MCHQIPNALSVPPLGQVQTPQGPLGALFFVVFSSVFSVVFFCRFGVPLGTPNEPKIAEKDVKKRVNVRTWFWRRFLSFFFCD